MIPVKGAQFLKDVTGIKFLSNMVEQDHRTIRRRIRPMLGFKSFVSASATA